MLLIPSVESVNNNNINDKNNNITSIQLKPAWYTTEMCLMATQKY